MTYDRFKHLICLMYQNRRYIYSIYQEYSPKKKANGFIVAVVTDTSSAELKDLIKEGFGFCIFDAEIYGTIELWIYDTEYESYEHE